MKLIANWRKAYRMLSVQSMAVATALQGAWVVLPEDMKATVPPHAVYWITMGLLVFGFPPRGAHTISQRLAIYRVKETGIKQQVAIVLCDLLSELDPTGAHC